jgi:uncharacterized protein (DUF1778 family)
MQTVKNARFDTKLTLAQKQLFEQAATLGGYRSLSDFVIKSAEAQAKEIVKEHNRILVSEQDRNTFFDTLLNPPAPGKNLKKAAARYKEFMNTYQKP